MERIIELAKREIPSPYNVLEEAWYQLSFSKSFVKNNFGESIVKFDEKATEIYRNYEKIALIKLAQLWLNSQKEEIREKLEEIIKQKGWDKFIEKASKIFVEFGELVQNFEKHLGNMRKARGGKGFEEMVLRLLKFIDIECESPPKKIAEKLGRIDIIIPSTEVALKTPDRAFFLTCKRTLRERWRQEVSQAQLNWRIYLLTIDENVSINQAEEINKKGLIAFIRDNLKEKEPFKNMPWIRKLSNLPKELERI